MTEFEKKVTEVNESIDWEHLGDLGNFMTSPRSQDVWNNREFRKVRESNDGYVFIDTDIVPSALYVGDAMTNVDFMEHSIEALTEIDDRVTALAMMLNDKLDNAHTLLGVTSIDETRTWMPYVYQWQTRAWALDPEPDNMLIIFGIVCWGNIIDEHGNATGKWKGCKTNEISFSNGNH